MNQTAENILNGPEYFYCERYRCRMKKTECVRRQTRRVENSFELDYQIHCKDCAQGIEVNGEINGLDVNALRRERKAFAYKQIMRIKGRKKLKMDSAIKSRNDGVGMDPRLRGNDGMGRGNDGRKHVGAGLASAREEDGMESKICKVCGEKRDLDEFGKNKRASDGHINTCNSCVKPRGGDRKSVKVKAKAPVVEITEASDPAILSARVTIPQVVDNSEAYRSMAMAFISRIERRVIDAVAEGLKD